MELFLVRPASDLRPGDRIKHCDAVRTVEAATYAGPEFGTYVFLDGGEVVSFAGEVMVLNDVARLPFEDRI
jgi:hypothetical protein